MAAASLFSFCSRHTTHILERESEALGERERATTPRGFVRHTYSKMVLDSTGTGGISVFDVCGAHRDIEARSSWPSAARRERGHEANAAAGQRAPFGFAPCIRSDEREREKGIHCCSSKRTGKTRSLQAVSERRGNARSGLSCLRDVWVLSAQRCGTLLKKAAAVGSRSRSRCLARQRTARRRGCGATSATARTIPAIRKHERRVRREPPLQKFAFSSVDERLGEHVCVCV